jgi:YbgC/YbaW family acyl-CoA thioester hydrolase
MTTVTTQRRLTMGDVDAVQVYAPQYFRWMDQGTTELLVALGHPLRDLLAAGYGMPAVKALCEYVAPVGLDDVLTCTSWIGRAGTSSVDFVHEFTCGERAVARGVMTHVWVEMSDGQRPVPVPDWVREAVRASAPTPREPAPGVTVSKCETCDRVAFPAEVVCLTCAAFPVQRRTGADGTLVSWTTVHQAAAEFPTPFVLGWVQLADAPVPVLGRFTDPTIPELKSDVAVRVSSTPDNRVLLEVAA